MNPNRARYLAALLGMALLCLTNHPAIAAEKLADIRTVGIISGFGDTLALQRIGNWVFSNSDDTVSVSEWRINDIAVEIVSAALRNKLSIKSVANDPSTFAEESKNTRNWKQKRFVALPENADIDAYIMILPAVQPDPLGTSISLEGLGFLNHDRPFGSPKLALYALYKVYIVNPKTGRTIDYGSAQVPDSPFLSDPSPFAAMQESQWVASASQLNPDQKTMFKEKIVELIRKSLPYAFANANFPLY